MKYGNYRMCGRGAYINFVILLTTFIALDADNRLVLPLSHLPLAFLENIQQEASQQAFDKKIAALNDAMVGKVSQKMVKYSLASLLNPSLSGFVALYAGFVDTSNRDGLLTFPLRQVVQKVYLAITPEIDLSSIKGNTISHREFKSDSTFPIQLFQYELKKENKKFMYWDVNEIPIPEDKNINPLTVVLLSHPKNLYIKTGKIFCADATATESIIPHLVLPEIYVLGRIGIDTILLSMLDIKRFFEPIVTDVKKQSDVGVQKIITNL